MGESGDQLLFVNAAVAIVGDIGVTIIIITKDFVILTRTLFVHGTVITEGYTAGVSGV